jgi:hypothetical protein
MNLLQIQHPPLKSRHPTNQPRKMLKQLRLKKQHQRIQHPKPSPRLPILLRSQTQVHLLKQRK